MRITALFLLAACGTPTSPTGDTSTPTTPSVTTTPPVYTTPTGPQGPTVTSLELSADTLTQDGSTTITAVVDEWGCPRRC